ncbi:5-deoxy-glucuronate isomerase [Hartmannibacter diazotrophicus]|uniref:5-deoxy-glucuronate isomerase n=1 Tax=Hartmannibacter diazotrophicus TaxID=1482074 RepID=A0A2C9D1V8_9HYPH|nr:5-deoxy-glucuronate isomerase [Hartmannibacter diazotrophicus]SON53791.1 5-deoxy-glucuronate isomerase [Hartmannibacter diazotrophicus]
MPNLKVKPKGDRGLVHEITPESAGWGYVGFALHKLQPGETVAAETGDREVCIVFVSGKGKVSAEARDFGEIGGRMSPFEGPPHAVYVPMGSGYSVTATTEAEVAICSAPGGGAHEARHIPPGTHPQMTRGKATNTRYVTNIMPEDDGAAHALLVVEVITPGGHTSSYPPHKHDEDDLPRESYLEETYYHRFHPAQGFAMQRVYTDDRSLDETMAVEDGDVVMVPKGYHPVAAIHGYDSYYLNVMAGPHRVWKFHNAPEHAWLFTGV